MAESLVKLSRQGPVAILSLNRAKRHNALMPELLLARFLNAHGLLKK